MNIATLSSMPSTLVVYYSRTGTTSRVARAIAALLGADSEEIRDTVNRKGLWGYFLAGRDASRKTETKILPLQHDLSAYDLVIVGTPIWAWTLAAPVRTFLSQYGKNIRRFGFFWTMGGSTEKDFLQSVASLCSKEPEAVLGLKDKMLKEDRYAEEVKRFAETF